MKKYDLDFENTRNLNIEKMGGAPELDNLSREWMKKSAPYNYVYNFDWMNTPIIQFPQDIVAMQELIFKHEPDLIIETGVARGGSVLFSASMLSLLDLRKSLKDNVSFERKRKVIGIDIDIREHTRQAINDEPLSTYVELIEGSSIEQSIIDLVHQKSDGYENIMVFLDSNHTHEHVLAELNGYQDLIKSGGYLVVYDTSIEWDDAEYWEDNREWGPGNSPRSAISEFIESYPNFKIDKSISNKLQITVAPEGFLRKD
jgi:cephalosporin hydroxylase